jgi:hypothetical protein
MDDKVLTKASIKRQLIKIVEGFVIIKGLKV